MQTVTADLAISQAGKRQATASALFSAKLPGKVLNMLE
jgi:hypothetical protein